MSTSAVTPPTPTDEAGGLSEDEKWALLDAAEGIDSDGGDDFKAAKASLIAHVNGLLAARSVPANPAPHVLYVESLAHYLHNRSSIGRFCGWELLPSEAKDAYVDDARSMAGVLIRVTSSEVRQYEREG